MSDNRPSHMLTDAELKARVDAFCDEEFTPPPKPIVKRGSYVRWIVTPKGKRELARIRKDRAKDAVILLARPNAGSDAELDAALAILYAMRGGAS